MTARGLSLALVLVLAGCAGNGEEPSARPTPLQRELRELARSLEEIHPDLFHAVSAAEFRGAARRLANAAPGLTRDELVVGVMRLAALPGPRDGHTGVFPFDAHARPLHVYPLRLYDFADGVHVIGAVAADDLSGRRLTSIEGRPLEEVVELVRPLVPHDNESSLRWRLPSYLVTAEVLRGLGIAGSGPATFGFADGSTAELEPVPARELANGLVTPLRAAQWERNPVWLREVDTEQWLTTLEGGRVAYLAYRATTAPAEAVLGRLARLARSAAVRRVVVDVRLNGGGSNTTYGPLLDLLAEPAISRKLVLLTGRQTFSAAGNFVADVARSTRARIVGELAGGAPSQWGDASELPLERAGLIVRVATVYHDYGPQNAVEPDVAVEPTAREFLSGRDPVLERALALP